MTPPTGRRSGVLWFFLRFVLWLSGSCFDLIVSSSTRRRARREWAESGRGDGTVGRDRRRCPNRKVLCSDVLIMYPLPYKLQFLLFRHVKFFFRVVSELNQRIEHLMEGAMELSSMEFGCSHYRRRCKIRAPCCGEIFNCRHCHNEAKNSIEVDPSERHDIPRHKISKVICSLCDTEQDVSQYCTSCGVCMGNYYCGKCKFFDDNVSKKQYHCDGCGICRTGGNENFFHCYQCGCCYCNSLKDSHHCVERAMHHNCPVCFEYLFDSTKDITVPPCGHTIHLECLKEMRRHFQFSCPVCSKSVYDMSSAWEMLDQEVASTPMPEAYQNKMVWILCNDCGKNANVHYHVLAHKCPGCNSYNTRQTRGHPTCTAP